MIFLFPRWDMLIPCRVVPRIFGNPQWITWITWIADDEKLISYISGVLRVASCPKGRCELYWFGVPWRKWQIYLLKTTRGCFFERISQPEFCQEDVLAECFFCFIYTWFIYLLILLLMLLFICYSLIVGCQESGSQWVHQLFRFMKGTLFTLTIHHIHDTYPHWILYVYMNYTMEPIDDSWLWLLAIVWKVSRFLVSPKIEKNTELPGIKAIALLSSPTAGIPKWMIWSL